MSGKLSERFSQLKGTSNNRTEKGREQRVQVRAQTQTNQRSNQVNARRPGLIVKPGQQQGKKSNNNNKLNNAGGVKVNRPKVNDNNKRRPNSAGKGKGKGQQGKGNNKGKGNKKEKREKEAPVAAGDLDKQMAAYWHKAGKGPDPNKLELDQQLEAYRLASAASAAAETEMTA